MHRSSNPDPADRDAQTSPPPDANTQPVPRAAGAAMAGMAAVAVAVLLVVGVISRDGGDTPGSSTLAGVEVFDVASREHVPGPVQYAQSPPVGGAHASVWQNCGFYRDPVPDEQAVHSLEHGAVWITYRPRLSADDQSRLRELAQSDSHVLVSPVEDLPAPVVASAWGRQLGVETASAQELDAFVNAYRLGPQTPEPGAPCSGGAGRPSG